MISKNNHIESICFCELLSKFQSKRHSHLCIYVSDK